MKIPETIFIKRYDLDGGIHTTKPTNNDDVEYILKTHVTYWKEYSEQLEKWWCKHQGKTDTMEAGMSRPNKPGYFRANND